MNDTGYYIGLLIGGFFLGVILSGMATTSTPYWKRQELYDNCIEFNTHEVCEGKAMTLYPLDYKKKP